MFRHLVDPELYVRWMGTEAMIDARPGGTFRIVVGGGPVAVGEYVVVEPPELLVYTWGWENDEAVPPGSSTVEISLREDGEETLLTLRHAGLPGDPMIAAHREGWTRYTERLSVVATGGDPGPDEPMGGSDGR